MGIYYFKKRRHFREVCENEILMRNFKRSFDTIQNKNWLIDEIPELRSPYIDGDDNYRLNKKSVL